MIYPATRERKLIFRAERRPAPPERSGAIKGGRGRCRLTLSTAIAADVRRDLRRLYRTLRNDLGRLGAAACAIAVGNDADAAGPCGLIAEARNIEVGQPALLHHALRLLQHRLCLAIHLVDHPMEAGERRDQTGKSVV